MSLYFRQHRQTYLKNIYIMSVFVSICILYLYLYLSSQKRLSNCIHLKSSEDTKWEFQSNFPLLQRHVVGIISGYFNSDFRYLLLTGKVTFSWVVPHSWEENHSASKPVFIISFYILVLDSVMNGIEIWSGKFGGLQEKGFLANEKRYAGKALPHFG